MKRQITKSIRVLFCATMLTGFIVKLSAQDLFQVLEQSRQQYPTIKAKLAEVNSADKRVASSKTERLPGVFFQDQYTFSSNNNMTGSFFPNEGVGISTTGAALPADVYHGVYGSMASVIIDWKVFGFGKVRAGIDLARSNKGIAETDYENELFQHQVRVIEAYLSQLTNYKLIQAQENNLKRAAHVKDVVRAGVRSGMRPGVDSMLANVEFSKASMSLSEFRRNQKVVALRLTELTGSENASWQLDSMSFYNFSPFDSAHTSSHLHPRLKWYQAQVQGAFAKSKAVQLSYMPGISLLANGLARGSGNDRTTGVPSQNFTGGTSYHLYNYLVGVSLRWNVTALVRMRHDYKSEKFQAEKFTHFYEEQSLALKRQYGEAQAQMKLTEEQALLVPMQLEAARAAYSQAEARYSNGLTDITTLNQSYYLLNRAETDYWITATNRWKALLINAATAGDLSLFLSQVK